MKKILLTGLMTLLVLGLLIPATGLWLLSHLDRPLEISEQQVVEVRPGASLSGVIRGMARDGWLGDEQQAERTRMAVRLQTMRTGLDQRLHVGEYRVQPGDSLARLLARFERGEVIQYAFTLVEGWTFRELRQQMALSPVLENTLTGLTDEQVMERLGEPELLPEGWFAPDTYFFTRAETDLDLLRRALRRQQGILEQAWQARQDDLPLDSPYEALILASIVERETGVPHERGEIAGVFVNRLRKGMRLQTDPTVIYGMGERYDGRIRSRDLREATPWNTYVIWGLPPTPIAMPGEAAIRATLDPEETTALFFVARGDGSHQFSETLREHNEAVRRYQLNRRADYRSFPPAETPATEQQ